MSELEQAALEGAAPEVVEIPDIEAPEVAENTDGQEEGQPDKPLDKTKSQQRRERREAAIKQSAIEKEAAEARESDLKRRLDRIKSARESEVPPKESDFSDVIEYAAAQALWKQRQADTRLDVAEIESEAGDYRKKAETHDAQIRAERVAEFADQVAEKRTQYADIDQVLAVAAQTDVVGHHIAEMVLSSESPVDLAYHLGKNPALARQISRLPPLEAARELGRIEARLTLPKPNLETKAPAPIAPVRPGGTATKDPAKMSASEWRAWRESGGRF